MRLETLAIHAAHHPDPLSGAVSPPIHLATTFARGPGGELPSEFIYARTGNPTRAALEAALAQMEGGAAAFAFASGLAAIHAVLQTVPSGGHILAPADVYHGTRRLLLEMEARGTAVTFADLSSTDQLTAALQPNTRLIFVETPSNPLLKITDIRAAAEQARAAGAALAVDNTWATPVLQRPLDLGADYAVHSTTKYFGGHSDVTGGAVVCREDGEAARRIAGLQNILGAVPSPFDCWLVRRGMMTLPLRVRAQSEGAGQISRFLAAHRKVEAVHYPGLAAHPGHTVARAQMSGFGGMLSFQVRGGQGAAAGVIARLELIVRATSLGGVESLIEHRYRVEGADSRTPHNLLRLSVGLEHPEDLIADLAQALDGAML
jgi:cystathionine gamma-synthase